MVESGMFSELVGGVVWLVRRGENYVSQSSVLEEMGTQETGRDFATIVSARTAIGHDADGALLLVQVDGQSYRRGIHLNALADMLTRLGAVNAINLDGGGSSTSVGTGGTLMSMPSDACTDAAMAGHAVPAVISGVAFKCERPVTSVTCIHDAVVSPSPEPAP